MRSLMPGGPAWRGALRAACHLLVAAALFVVPAAWFGGMCGPSLGTPLCLQRGVASGAYLLGAAVLEAALWRRWRVPALAVPVIALSAYGVGAIGLLAMGGGYSRRLLLVSVAVGCVLLTINVVRPWALGMIAAAGAVGVGGVLLRSSEPDRPAADSVPAFLDTAHEWLEVVSYLGRLPATRASGGALAILGDGYLLAVGDGRLFRLTFPGGDSLAVEVLATRVPINGDAFAALPDENLRRDWFRVGDLLVQARSDTVRLLASHHYWVAGQGCYVVRVSMLETTLNGLRLAATMDRWKTVFESTPCMSLDRGFLGLEMGGSLAALDESRILVALGHHGFDGVDRPLIVSQDPAHDFGKTILIDLRTGRSRHFTRGHRNPQGLHVSTDGRVWLTEHGPEGGDELNALVESANYGWPYETYGTQYGMRTWPLAPPSDAREAYTAPVFAWVPSRGITSVVELTGRAFPAWRGDLLVGSLGGMSLWRLRIREGRVVFAERIPLGRRIRDAVEGSDGRIVAWAGEKEILSVRPSRLPERGEALFAQCAACHPVNDGATHGIGPDLHRILERRVASAPGFPYSPALLRMGGTWDRDRLLAFLRDPAAFSPGTSMEFKGIPDSLSRVALLQYLADR